MTLLAVAVRLHFQFGLVGGEESANVGGFVEQRNPLLRVQGDGPTLEAVEGHAAFGRNLETDLRSRGRFDGGILGLQGGDTGQQFGSSFASEGNGFG